MGQGSSIFAMGNPANHQHMPANNDSFINRIKEGQILFVSDLADIYDNEKVASRALSVEEKRGNIVRLANGVYLRPKTTRFGPLFPTVDEMVQAIAKRDKAKVLPSGTTALNVLGLSTQVPTKYTYLTNGSGRRLRLGNRTVELKRSVPRNFAYRTRLAALLVQALKSLGEDNVTPREISTIKQLIEKEGASDALMHDISMMPAWMRKTILSNTTNIK